MSELTPAEAAAVRTLQRLAKTWPESLWLFAANGTLNVMKCAADGSRQVLPNDGYDADAAVTHINIACDGGDW
jgi:hypothetical protein